MRGDRSAENASLSPAFARGTSSDSPDRQGVHHRCHEYASTELLGGKNLATRPPGRLVYVTSSRPYHQEEEIMQANPALVTPRLGSLTSSVHVLAEAGGPAVDYTTRRSGTQTLEGPASTGTSSAASREPGSGRTGPQLVQEGRS